MLYVKFKQLDDTKTAVRDVIGFQKYFFPMQMQAAIGQNINELEVSHADHGYQIYSQNRYEDLALEAEALYISQKH